MKLPSLEKIRVVGSCQKVPKFDFQSQFSMSKIIQIFSFFALKNTNLGAHFLLFIEIFWQHQFLILYTSLENFTTGIAIIRVEVFNSCFWGEKDNFKGFFCLWFLVGFCFMFNYLDKVQVENSKSASRCSEMTHNMAVV